MNPYTAFVATESRTVVLDWRLDAGTVIALRASSRASYICVKHASNPRGYRYRWHRGYCVRGNKTCVWRTVNATEENSPSTRSQQHVFMEKPRFGRATIDTDNAIAREDEWTINRGPTWFVWGITTLNGVACLYRRALAGSFRARKHSVDLSGPAWRFIRALVSFRCSAT